jgi:hypothetical protein
MNPRVLSTFGKRKNELENSLAKEMLVTSKLKYKVIAYKIPTTILAFSSPQSREPWNTAAC